MLLSDATVWMMDEPFSALDEASVNRLTKELEQRKKGHLIFLISHERPLCANRILDMGDFSYDPDHIKWQYPPFLYDVSEIR